MTKREHQAAEYAAEVAASDDEFGIGECISAKDHIAKMRKQSRPIDNDEAFLVPKYKIEAIANEFRSPVSDESIDDDEPIDEAFAATMRSESDVLTLWKWLSVKKCRYAAYDANGSELLTANVYTRGELRAAVALAERLRT